MARGRENIRNTAQAGGRTHRTHQQQQLAADPVDYGHRNHREQQIGGADRHRLQVARHFAETGAGENVVQVVENGVDAGKLVEHGERNRQQNRQPVLARKQALAGMPVLGVDGGDDFSQLAFHVLRADGGQRLARFRHAALLRQPARAARNAEQHHQEQQGGEGGHAQLPAPFEATQRKPSQQVVGQIGQQYPRHHVELEEAHQAPAPFGGRNFGDVHGPQHRGAADAQTADEAEEEQRIPVPGESAAQGARQVQHRHQPQTVAAAQPVAGVAGQHRPDHRPAEGGGHREA